MVQCAGCDLPISDRFLLKVLDRVWHTKCVQCCDCKRSLTDRCYSREEKIYCRQDFYRRYGTKCSGCNQGISPHDLVRRARSLVFHVQCFQCSMCQKQITTGDELYYIGENRFICKNDYERTKQVTLPHTELEIEPKEFYQSPYDEDLEYGTKRRGPRTTIKAKQLETLKAAFSATPKPTRLIREKLAQETGLNMRVIQVWFQNRRSKERRMKQNRENGNTTPVNRPNGNRIMRTPRRNSERNGSTASESPDHSEEIHSEPNSIDFSHQDSEGNDVFPTNNFTDYFSGNQNDFSDISRASPSTQATTNLPLLVNTSNDAFSQSVNSPLQNSDYESPQTNGNSSNLTPLQPLAVSTRGNFNSSVLQHAGANPQTVGMW